VSIVVLPVLFEGQIKAVIELAALHELTPGSLAFLDLLTPSIGVVFNTIEATMPMVSQISGHTSRAGRPRAQGCLLPRIGLSHHCREARVPRPSRWRLESSTPDRC
jgi:hypothetical protein